MRVRGRYLKSIRGKILASMLVITLLTLLSVTLIFYRQSARTIENNYISSQQQRARQLMDELDGAIQRAYHTTVYASCDGRLKENILLYLETEEERYLEALAQLLQEYKKQNPITSSMYLLIPGGCTVVTSEDYPVYRREIHEDRVQTAMREMEENAAPMLTEDLVYDGQILFSCAEKVNDEGGNLLGYVMSNTDERKLYYDYLAGWGDAAGTESVILDRQGRIVAGSGDAHMGELYGGEEKYRKWIAGKETAGSDGGSIYIYCFSTFAEAGLFTIVDKTAVLGDLLWIRRFFFGILSAFLGIALILALYLSGLIYRPLRQLTHTMEEVSGGKLHTRAQVETGDEIGELAREFNEMLDKIEDLIGRLIEEENKKKDVELEALQYQITPHFMYNTLNSIKYAALLKGDREIGRVIGDFVELLQAAVSKKGTFLTVSEEIYILQNYIRLQEFRYGGGFEVTYELEEEAQQCLVPRLILQPLAENALLHGMDLKENKGKIMISASLADGRLYLKVTDNGRGMSRAQIDALMSAPTKKERGFTAVGIPNVRDRLKLYYGEQGGLLYESSENGTTAVIYLPAEKGE